MPKTNPIRFFSWPLCFALLVTLVASDSFGGTTYIPGQDEFGTLLFEDQWPQAGDFDFNDLVIRYNYQCETDAGGAVQSLKLMLTPVAAGATKTNSLALRLPMPAATPLAATLTIGSAVTPIAPDPGESDLVIKLFDDFRNGFVAPPSGFINTDTHLPVVAADPLTLVVDFAAPVPIDLSEAPFDLFIYPVGDPSHQTHLPQYYGTDTMNTSLFGTGDDASDPPPGDGGTRWFVDADGLPWVLNIPEAVTHPNVSVWPKETVPIDDAYPLISLFASSGGTLATDWYLHPVLENLYAPVPEPAFWVLMASGGLATWVCRTRAGRRQRRAD